MVMRSVMSVLICIVLSAAGYADMAQVVNPGFESMSGNPLMPDGWSTYNGTGATVYYGAKTDVVYSGIYSFKVAARNGYGMIHQAVTTGFTPGETYSLWFYGRGDTNSDWVMDEPLDRVEMSVKFANSAGGTISEPKIVVFDGDPTTAAPVLVNNQWLQSPVLRFTVPQGTASIVVKISSIDGSPDGNSKDGTSIHIDDVTLALLPVPAKNPAPAVGATEQNPVSLFLNWQPGDDPLAAGTPNPDVTGYFVYVDTFDASAEGDPNFMNPVYVSGTQYPSSGTGAAFGADQIVYWRVDTSISGSTADDPNTVTGDTWYFETESSFPEISSQPQDVTVFEGEPAAITLEATGISPIVQYDWFNSSDQLVASGATLNVLHFASTVIEDSNSFYCVVTNSEGKATQSQAAELYVKGVLAQYDFENNLSDTTGRAEGTAKNIDPNFAGVVSYDSLGISGSALVLDGANYVQLSEGAYPNAYMGLANGTLVCWIKTASATTGTLIGAYNDGHTTCYNLSVQTPEQLYFSIRTDDNRLRQIQVAAPGIRDGNWHQIVATYALGDKMVLYMDGEALASLDGLPVSAEFSSWTYSLPIGAGDSRGVINNVHSGAIDGMILYNYAKTEKEVLDMYNALAAETKSLCLDPYASMFDLAGPEGVGAEYADCQVNLYDFAAMAAAWLDCGLYPACSQ